MKKRFLGVVLLCLFSGRLPAQSQTLDPTNFVVLGGGLASGYANFQLVGRFQEKSFPVLMADQMKTIMPMPLFREAPAGVYVSFNPQPDLLPDINQSVLRGLPFPLFTFNLSVPFLRVSESVNRRPAPPFVHEGNLKQTMINLILGYPVLILDTPALWTQVEYAEFMAPTLVIVQLGFGDVLQGAISGDPGQISSSSGFASDYQTIVDRVKGTHATVILMNVPDPVDTAYFTDLESACSGLSNRQRQPDGPVRPGSLRPSVPGRAAARGLYRPDPF